MSAARGALEPAALAPVELLAHSTRGRCFRGRRAPSSARSPPRSSGRCGLGTRRTAATRPASPPASSPSSERVSAFACSSLGSRVVPAAGIRTPLHGVRAQQPVLDRGREHRRQRRPELLERRRGRSVVGAGHRTAPARRQALHRRVASVAPARQRVAARWDGGTPAGSSPRTRARCGRRRTRSSRRSSRRTRPGPPAAGRRRRGCPSPLSPRRTSETSPCAVGPGDARRRRRGSHSALRARSPSVPAEDPRRGGRLELRGHTVPFVEGRRRGRPREPHR